MVHAKTPKIRMTHPALLLAGTVLLAACGGGSSGGANIAPSGASGIATAQSCAPDNPYRADATSATTAGSLANEKAWLRAYVDAAYLWYNEVPSIDANAAPFSGPMSQLDGRGVPLPISNYFEALKTPAITPSGKRRDQFSFTYPTKAWNDLSQSGVSAGYGVEWKRISSSPPRNWRVAFVQLGTPAATAGLQRGDTLKTVDGVDFANGSDVNAINAALFPQVGTTHSFVLARVGSADVSVNMTAANVTLTPVPQTKTFTNSNGAKVGYILFNDHIATSEAQLIAAVNQLKTDNVTELILDLRYNGGGYLFIASRLSYMIAGGTRTQGKFFEKLQYNSKRTTENNQAATPFYDTACILNNQFQCTSNQPLPTLNLGRVYVLVQGDTCSASEAIVNGLRGIDVDVQLIGTNTCGKPYGFTAKDNCGISYFPVEFQGNNYKGFGDYADGFIPAGTGTTANNVPGCRVNDDLSKPLGDATEAMIATALFRQANPTSCPNPALASILSAGAKAEQGSLLRSPVRENRFLVPGGTR
jgi:hypothetical protein